MISKAEKGSIEILESLEKIAQNQFETFSKYFNGKNESEQNLLTEYGKFKRAISEYKKAVEKYYDSLKESLNILNFRK